MGIRRPTDPELTYERIRFHLDDGSILIFNDPRTLGRALIIGDPDDHHPLAVLGPDALEISGQIFVDAIRKKRSPVKVILLDQSFVAGVGDIYAQEACFVASG